MKTRPNTYTSYSIACAAVWALILIVTQIEANSHTQRTFWLVSLGWWIGWTSATIARAVYPPPNKRRSTTTTT
jgi:hypothetical protein